MQRFLAGYSNREKCRNFETTHVNVGIHFIKFCCTKTNLPLLFCIFADIRLELWETSQPKNDHKQINLFNVIKSQNELKGIKTFKCGLKV
jgi:hypothetical protein